MKFSGKISLAALTIVLVAGMAIAEPHGGRGGGDFFGGPMLGFFTDYLDLTDAQQAERIYNALAENAQNIGMPLGETFWAHRFAMFTDRYGIPWMINCEKAGQTAA